LTTDCIVTKQPCPKLKAAILTELIDVGMLPLSLADELNAWKNSYTVMLDGKVIGLIQDTDINNVVNHLRILKTEGKKVG